VKLAHRKLSKQGDAMSLPADPVAAAAIALIEPRLAEREGLLVAGICGAQGSGKSTLAAVLEAHFQSRGVPTASLSLDDLYLPRRERATRAADIHALLQTRGVPGTHDVAEGLALIAALASGARARLPRFDKAIDDRAPRDTWPSAGPHLRLLVFEGWCIGARPQPEAALKTPLNALERDEDADGVWRRHVQAALAGPYQKLFARLDLLILLKAPDFAIVRAWRGEQEDALRRRSPGRPGIMDAVQLDRFVQHYERLTRHILAEMPARADLVVELAADRSPRAIRRR
jgi:D-glycerate 3-kinase